MPKQSVIKVEIEMTEEAYDKLRILAKSSSMTAPELVVKTINDFLKATPVSPPQNPELSGTITRLATALKTPRARFLKDLATLSLKDFIKAYPEYASGPGMMTRLRNYAQHGG
jgi:hypothetical protein